MVCKGSVLVLLMHAPPTIAGVNYNGGTYLINFLGYEFMFYMSLHQKYPI